MNYIDLGFFIILIICSVIILYLYLVCPILWVCFFFSVYNRYTARKNSTEKENGNIPRGLIIRKFLKNWTVWFFILLLLPGAALLMPDIAAILAYTEYPDEIFPITDFSISTIPTILVLAIPYGYFSMIFYNDSRKTGHG